MDDPAPALSLQAVVDALPRESFDETHIEEPNREPYDRQPALPEDVVAFFRRRRGAWLRTSRKI